MWKDHEKFVRESLKSDLTLKELKKLLILHNEKIVYLQHERLIHLLVTLTVAIATLIILGFALFLNSVMFLIPDLMLLALLIAYLIHYRNLELTVQRWYGITDQIRKNKTKRDTS